jgi:uracil-DNA glycosylase
MQPTITSFFKTKYKTVKKEDSAPNGNDEQERVNTVDDPDDVDDFIDDDESDFADCDTESQSLPARESPPIITQKRLLDSDDDSEDDVNFSAAKRYKRRVLSSSNESTPVKGETDRQQKKEQQKDNNDTKEVESTELKDDRSGDRKNDAKGEVEGDAKEEGKSDAKDSAKSGAKEEGKSDAKDSAKSGAKEEGKSDAKDSAKGDAKEEGKSDTKGSAKSDANDDAKGDAKNDAKGDAKSKTPSKVMQNLFPQKATVQSPLFNVELLVKKKISSGAFALHENIGASWFKALQGEFDKPYFKKLSTFVQEQRKQKTVYPPPEQVYTWTHHHAIKDTRVVIIGQDPYHGPNQAHGLSFSVHKGVPIPKSLQNIYKELQNDIPGFKHPGHGDLTGWSKQGVLLLNACLTVNKGEANSHQGKGWETFTSAVISWISKNVNHNVVFLLWGRFAQKKSTLIDKRHKIFNSAHPSPLSAENGFFGCKHFSQTNAYLRSQNMAEIDWSAL